MSRTEHNVTSCARRLATLIVAFSCASFSGGQDSTASQPATKPLETIAAARQQLARLKPDERSRHDTALLTALEFVLAVGEAQGPRAALRVDAAGYQGLPLTGELSERPEKPLARGAVAKETVSRQKAGGGKSRSRSSPATKDKEAETIDSSASETTPAGGAAGAGRGGTLSQLISARPKVEVAVLPAACVEVAEREKLRTEFPAIATWLLPLEDLAVVIRPPPAGPLANWLTYDACLVVRLRGDHAVIMGGNLLEALGIPPQP